MDIFTRFPTVQYNGVNVPNILSKVALIREHFTKFTVYYPYRIKEGERPDTIAYDYYGKSSYAWLVRLSNDMVDPYYDWPLTQREFHDALYAKYGSTYTLKSVVSHYVYTGIGGNTEDEIDRIDFKMSPATYAALTVDEKAGWTPVYVYDHEYQLNEDKRQIKLLSNAYLKQVDREIALIFNGR